MLPSDPAPGASPVSSSAPINATDPVVPIQIVTFGSSKTPTPTSQLSVASFHHAGPAGPMGAGGWVIGGDVTLTLQLPAVEPVQATFRIQAYEDGAKKVGIYNVTLNGQTLVDHEHCTVDRGWHPHAVVLPANVLTVGANTIMLSVSDRGGSLGLESVTVQSGFSAP